MKKRKVNYIHEFSELNEYFDMPVKTYSSGMRARLTFASSMAFDFDIYLMDELTAVGDARFKEKSRAALQEKKNKSVIIKVSHNMQELIRDCEVGLLMKDGEVSLFEDIKEAVAFYNQEA